MEKRRRQTEVGGHFLSGILCGACEMNDAQLDTYRIFRQVCGRGKKDEASILTPMKPFQPLVVRRQ
jgi:hypothetical protein